MLQGASPACLARTAGAALLCLGMAARPLCAQAPATDTTHVTYRTRDVVFVAAGRASGVAVGDTLDVLLNDTTTLVQAVVLSLAERSASARLLNPDAPVDVGARVRFRPHPLEVAAAPAPDTVPRDTASPASAPVAPSFQPSEPRLHWRGGIQLDQYATSAGVGGLDSYQSAAGFTLTAPLSRAFEVRIRSRARWRSGTGATTTGLDGFWNVLYQAEARIGSPGGAFQLSLGRFIPSEMMAIGYLDGAKIDVRLGGSQHVGLIGGFVPTADKLGFSSATSRFGGYWAFGGDGPVSGAFGAAADWSQGAHRRTQLAAQGTWRPGSGLSFSVYADADVPAAWDTLSSGTRLTTLYANLYTPLPLGFRGGIGVESHEAARLWEFAAVDTFPLPGRLQGATASLGHGIGRASVDLTAGYLQRQGDPSGTWRGTLSVFAGPLAIMATAQHGDLADYGSMLARIWVAQRSLPVSLSLSGLVSMTRTPGGGVTSWRYSLRPELTRSFPGGVFLSLGCEVATFAGTTTTDAHAGLSYYFR